MAFVAKDKMCPDVIRKLIFAPTALELFPAMMDLSVRMA